MGSTALLPLRRKACWGFFRPEKSGGFAGFEPSNLATKGQHATPRPPKPQYIVLQDNVLFVTFVTLLKDLWIKISNYYFQAVYSNRVHILKPAITFTDLKDTKLITAIFLCDIDWPHEAGHNLQYSASCLAID